MKKYSKAIMAFLGLVVTNEVAVLANTSHAAPVGLHGWAVALLTTAAGTAAVYFKSNGFVRRIVSPPPVTPPS